MQKRPVGYGRQKRPKNPEILSVQLLKRNKKKFHNLFTSSTISTSEKVNLEHCMHIVQKDLKDAKNNHIKLQIPTYHKYLQHVLMGIVLVQEVQVLLLAESIQVFLFLYPHSKIV